MVRAFYGLAFSPAETAFHGLDSGVVAAAFAAGVPHSALGEMQNLIAAGPLTRLKPEPKKNITAPKPKAMEELEGEEADSRGRSRRAWIKCPAQCTAQRPGRSRKPCRGHGAVHGRIPPAGLIFQKLGIASRNGPGRIWLPGYVGPGGSKSGAQVDTAIAGGKRSRTAGELREKVANKALDASWQRVTIEDRKRWYSCKRG